MKKEQDKTIASNRSSGAEKVEIIEQEKQGDGTELKATVKTQRTAKGEAAMGGETRKTARISAKKVNAESAGSKAEKESEAAKERVERALAKKKAQAEKKERRAKALAEKKAQAEQKKAEKEEKRRLRAKEKASRKNAAAKKKSEKKKQGEKRHNDGKERAKGYGGWLAAVIALGAVTLGLTAAVTVGAVEMSNTKTTMLSSNKGTMYELTGIMEHVDEDLDRARVSASSAQQSRILTDLLVQARLAEADMEKMPIDMERCSNVTSFINRVAFSCEQMLGKLRNGEELDAKDREILENLYNVNHSVRVELDKLMNEMTDDEWTSFLKDGEGMLGETIGRLEKMTLEENHAEFGEKPETGRAGMRRDRNSSEDDSGKGIDCATAETLCERYFGAYDIDGFQCVGETNARMFAAYNVQGYDKNGSLLFAEIDKRSGALIAFDYYEDCGGEKFDLDNAEVIAESFLEELGYEDMSVVRFRNNGSNTDFTFVYEKDGVVYYPDEIHVKVCRTRGVVSGMEAGKYLAHHRDREEPSVKLTLEKAKDGLYDGLTVEASRLAVVQAKGGERPAYEFFCSYREEQYFVYVDANNGNELAIVNAKNIE